MFFCTFCPNLPAIEPAVNIVDLFTQKNNFFILIFQLLTNFKNFLDYGLEERAGRWAGRF